MMLAAIARIAEMSPWEVIDEALARKKKKPQWLAEKLDVSAQVITNWKKRGVPPARFRAIAEVLDLTVDQLEHAAPLPWEKETAGWPFPQIDRARFDRLDDWQKIEIQGKVREMIEKFESAPGKSTDSQSDARRKSNGR